MFETFFEDLPQNLPSTKEKALQFYQNPNLYKELFQYQP